MLSLFRCLVAALLLVAFTVYLDQVFHSKLMLYDPKYFSYSRCVAFPELVGVSRIMNGIEHDQSYKLAAALIVEATTLQVGYAISILYPALW